MPSPTSPALRPGGPKEVELKAPATLAPAAPRRAVLKPREDEIPVPKPVAKLKPAVELDEEEVPMPHSSAAAESAHLSSSAPPVSSPTEMPVPTDVPSPTSPTKHGVDATGSDLPSVPTRLSKAVPAPMQEVAQVPELSGSAPQDTSAQMSSGAPNSPTEMPVPTDVPSPSDEEGVVAGKVDVPTAVPPTVTIEAPTKPNEVPTAEPPVPTVATAATAVSSTLLPLEETEVPPVASASAAALSSSAAPPSSPDEMPVPTDVPSPTSPAGPETQVTREAPTTEAPPTVLPADVAKRLRETTEVPTAEPPTLVPPEPVPTARPLEAPTIEATVEPPTLVPPTVAPPTVEATQQLDIPEYSEEPEQVPTDVPSPTSPAFREDEVATILTAEPTLPGPQDLAPTSPASPDLAEDQALHGPPGQVALVGEAKRRRLEPSAEPRGPSAEPRRRWGAPPAPATPTEDAAAPATPTEDLGLPGTPKGAIARRASSAGRASSAERESPYLVQEREEPLPPTPTYTGDSPTYQDENEPPTPTLEVDDEDLYAWEQELATIGPTPGAAVPSTATARPAAPLDPAQLRQLSPMELARRLAAPGALTTVPEAPRLIVVRGAGAPPPPVRSIPVARLPGMESPTPTFDPDEEDEDELIAKDAPPEGAYLQPASQSGPSASAARPDMPPLASEVFPDVAGRRRRGAEGAEELPPWKRRQRRRQL